MSCSHNRAINYFQESISSTCSFLGFKCSNSNDLIDAKCTSCANGGCSSSGSLLIYSWFLWKNKLRFKPK